MLDQPTASARFFRVGMAFELDPRCRRHRSRHVARSPPLGTLWRDLHTPAPLATAAVLGAVATLPLLAGLFVMERLPWAPLVRLQQLVETQLVPLFAHMSLWQLLLIALAAGLGEELLFRGWLQASLTDWIGPPLGVGLALAVTSVAFGACHWLTPAYGVLALLISVYLGLLFLLTDSILAPIVCHALYDFIALVYLVRRDRRSPGSGSLTVSSQPEVSTGEWPVAETHGLWIGSTSG